MEVLIIQELLVKLIEIMPTYLDIISKKREIETLTDGSQHPFPSDMEDPDVKETDDYGLLIAKAIFYSNPSSGSSMFFNNRKEYQDYVNYALGEQSEDIYKPLLRIKPKESGTTFVGALNWAIKNYATKRVNIAVSKVSERIFDPQVDALDQNAVDQRERVRQKIKFYIDFREQNREIESILKEQLSPKEIDPSLLPNTSDELELWMNTGYKYAEGVVIEKLIMHHMDRNRYPNIKRMNAFDSFVLGVSCLFIGMDDNTLPEIYRCDPGDMIVPLTDREDFSDIGFAGHYMTPTIAEFYKMVGDSKSKDWVKEMVKRHGKTSPLAYYGPQTNTLGSVTDQTRMEIIRFAYKSTNEMVHVSKVDKFGNQRFLEKNYNEYKKAKEG